MDRATWIDRCTMHLGRLRPDVEAEACAEVAADLWTDASDLEPEDAAETEVLSWPFVPL